MTYPKIKVERIYPYGKHESHIWYWASLDEKFTFSDDDEWEYQCDQTGDCYCLDQEESIMILNLDAYATY